MGKGYVGSQDTRFVTFGYDTRRNHMEGLGDLQTWDWAVPVSAFQVHYLQDSL